MFSVKTLNLLCIGAIASVLLGVTTYEKLDAKEAASSASTVAAAEAGKGLYQRRCGACHSIDANRIGPKHRGVFGREAGSQPDYNYSKALSQSDLVWNKQTLDQWLANPEATIPGQKMGYRLSNAEERQAIIVYLRSHSKTSAAP